MEKKIKIIGIAAAIMVLTSCSISGITGDKNVVKEKRTVEGSFSGLSVSQGINLFLTQSDTVSIVVETDKNLQDILIVENKNGTLKIYFKDQIVKATKKNVYLSMPEVEEISASSGADIKALTSVKEASLRIEASSGADIKMTVDTEKLYCNASSGSDIDLKCSTNISELNASSSGDIQIHGTANSCELNASSGGDINAKDFISETVRAEVSSGADILLYAKKSLTANASSGGDIDYYGNPEELKINTSSGGDIKHKNK